MSAAQNLSSAFGKIEQVIQTPQRPQSSTKVKRKTSTPILIFSSAKAGSVEALVAYPFEYAKTRVQLHSLPGCRHNPFAVLSTMIKHDGLGAIYTGCSTLALGTAFKASVRICSFAYFRAQLSDRNGALTPLRGVLAGSLAGPTESVIVVTPTEQLKTLLIETARGRRTKPYRGELHACETFCRTRGLRSLYRGLFPTMLKQLSTQGVKMDAYNYLREASCRHNVPQDGTTVFLTSALAGIVTAYVTQPFDTIKTWAQSARSADTIDAYRCGRRQAGVRGLWAESTARVGRLGLSSSILYTVRENVAA
ncbi:transmembrane transport [Ascochyta rabiei]|uniref:Transmembrane transport n=1 Tax=Didymella rabiei TaxID=5454 RepID=A0A163AS83_DIDRA|nr:transmembrane transport [Ascochyta rabiei]